MVVLGSFVRAADRGRTSASAAVQTSAASRALFGLLLGSTCPVLEELVGCIVVARHGDWHTSWPLIAAAGSVAVG